MSKYTKFSLTNPHYSSGESDRILLHNLFANMQMQQPLHSSRSTRVGSEGYYGGSSPFYSTGPVYRGMARNQQTGPVNQRMAPNASPSHQLQNQYRRPTSRLNRRRRRKEARKAVHPYRSNRHELSGTVSNNSSTGVNPGMAPNDASNNTRGMVWRTPSENPFVTDCNLT